MAKATASPPTAFSTGEEAPGGAALLRRLNIRCDLEACDDVLVGIRDGEKDLRRELDARREAGLDARWITPQSLRQSIALDAAGAIRVGSGFTLDPYRACLGLAAAAVSRGGILFERSVVKKVRVGRKR